MFIFADKRPLWLECASSMMMANEYFFPVEPISSRMNWNLWTVVMMIFLPSSNAFLSSPEEVAHATVLDTCMNCLMVFLICLSRFTRSVTTMTESITGFPSSFSNPIS